MRTELPEPVLWTVDQASAATGLSRAFLYRLAAREDSPLKTVRYGRALRFPRAQFETFEPDHVDDDGDDW